ncbi:DNA polymerase III subunit gamma/tau [Pseudothauera rhizosphaerae]|uniref:DNA polymerase III subunit gamma/tau n=1 Tax=Pseudothauera rhizosphaerae TaxID=2565932 RepID=A0A4S4AIW2_9RHOO|nr:DNA polymerase III subunit gamma/tau [Pseudothauera rhizosphaerae]THF59285.1 DNA polymerase III subunit gamma/tau [Pseudothauera rhizosphaerae]
MSYQVLARKWRPKSFGTLVGQEHVVRALTHALATGRLHHAWLFTGTRGVGKTTISRILAKALNCETGVTAEPCGQCAACLAIDADRFPDYVEMDAASNRGVDDMAALLDKAVYAPTQGRYKVYMIDEVHMLTGHAFNAMLKTLEEPPEHVKFILATTDPQKIPVTVLSRCLQFNLKQMPPGHIVDHLTRILQAEGVPFEAPALRHLAKAAHGSMRDALSLLDQAIAHGAGKVEEEQVTHMLGTVGDDHLYAVFDALLAGDVDALLAVADGMAARSLSFEAALQSLASLLHRIAVLQFAPAAIVDDTERARLQPYADGFDAEYLQLAYQIAIHGRDELALAPDEQAGFTMTLLRLHAFRPETPPPLGGAGGAGGGGAGRARALPAAPARPAAAQPRSAPEPAAAPPAAERETPAAAPPTPAVAEAPAPAWAAAAETPAASTAAPSADTSVPPWEELPPEAFEGAPAPRASEPPPPTPLRAPAETRMPSGTDDWHALLRALGLGGMVRELAQHCEWLAEQDGQVRLRLSSAHRHLLDMNAGGVERLQDQLSAHFGRPLRLKIEVGEIADATPAQRDQAAKEARHAQAVAALEADPFVRELIERFDATLLEASVRPL